MRLVYVVCVPQRSVAMQSRWSFGYPSWVRLAYSSFCTSCVVVVVLHIIRMVNLPIDKHGTRIWVHPHVLPLYIPGNTYVVCLPYGTIYERRRLGDSVGQTSRTSLSCLFQWFFFVFWFLFFVFFVFHLKVFPHIYSSASVCCCSLAAAIFRPVVAIRPCGSVWNNATMM